MGSLANMAVVALALICSACASLFRQPISDPVLNRGSDPCYNLSEENAQHPVKICELERSYVVRVIDKSFKFNKAEFQARFYDHLRSFIYRSAAPQKPIHGMTVDIWLAAPVFEPESPEWVAVVATGEGFLSFRLPFLLENWTMTGANAVWLGSEDHPTLRAIRTDQIVITPQPGVAPSEALRFVQDSGVMSKKSILGQPLVQRMVGDGSMIRLETLVLGAPQVARTIARGAEAKSHLMAINYSTAAGRDSYQAKVFRFTLP